MVRLWLASLGFLALGVIGLVSYAVSEVLAHPGISLVDAFWIGRLPWTPIGVGLVVAGATAALIFSSPIVLLRGQVAVRALSLAGLGAGALWWLDALVLGGPVSECAPPCIGGRPPSDVITIAYSSPHLAIALLLIPAITVSVVASLVLGLERRSGNASGIGDHAES